MRKAAVPDCLADEVEPIKPEILPGLIGPELGGAGGGGGGASGFMVPVMSVAALKVRLEIEPERLTLCAVPEIFVLEDPELLSVNTLEVPPLPVVEHVPVRALEKAGSVPITGVAANTEVKKATLAERRVFTKLALIHPFIHTFRLLFIPETTIDFGSFETQTQVSGEKSKIFVKAE